MKRVEFAALLAQLRACTHCASQLRCGPRPVLQADPQARLLIAGQAPGRKVHASGVPFDDASGLRLRAWPLAWHLPHSSRSVTAAVAAWRSHWPAVVPLPHPSPRNNGWLARHPWFERELLPALRARVAQLLAQSPSALRPG